MLNMKLAFFDIDGTLAVGRNIPKSTKEALTEFRSTGNQVWIATGRALPYVEHNFYEWYDGCISYNGRLASMKDGTVLYENPLTKEVITEVKDKLESIHAGYCFFTKEKGYYAGDMNGFSAMAESWEEGFVIPDTLPSDSICYSFDVYFRDDEVKEKVYEVLSDFCILNPHGIHPTMDVTVKGADKGEALRTVSSKLNICDTYAFGDGMNDLTLLEAARIGIAMGNGQEALKEKADYVTDPIHQDGICSAMKHFNLI